MSTTGGPESKAWRVLRSLLCQAGVHGERRDDKRGGGVGDVVYVHEGSGITGWVELKVLAGYPVTSKKGLLDYADLRPDQALWLANWGRRGGIAGVLLRVQGTTDTRPFEHWHYWRADGRPEWARDIRSWLRDEALLRATRSWCMVPDAGELGVALLTPSRELGVGW